MFIALSMKRDLQGVSEMISPMLRAGEVLRNLINENYSSQEEFAFDFGTDVRTVNRYVNNGINKIDTVQQLAMFFNVDFTYFFKEE